MPVLHGCFPPTMKVPTLTTLLEGPAPGRGLALLPQPLCSCPCPPPGSPGWTWRRIKATFLSLPQQANLSSGHRTWPGWRGLREQLFAPAVAGSTRLKDAPGTNQCDHSSVRMKTASAAALAQEGRGAQAKHLRKQAHHWGAGTFLAGGLGSGLWLPHGVGLVDRLLQWQVLLGRRVYTHNISITLFSNEASVGLVWKGVRVWVQCQAACGKA